MAKRTVLFAQSLTDHKRLANIINDLKSDSGLYLFGITLFIILVSVLLSLYLSKNITRPVLELSEAAQGTCRREF